MPPFAPAASALRTGRRRLIASSLALVLTAAVLLAALYQGLPSANAVAGTNLLFPNEVLNPGQEIHSANRALYLVMQTDGNLVLYGFNQGWNILWSTNTFNNPGATLVVQADGNIVVAAPGGQPLWWSGTYGNPGTRLQAQDDGNLVAVAPGERPVWATNTTLAKLIVPAGAAAESQAESQAESEAAPSCPPPPVDQPAGCESAG
jgi:hypothetical protein